MVKKIAFFRKIKIIVIKRNAGPLIFNDIFLYEKNIFYFNPIASFCRPSLGRDEN